MHRGGKRFLLLYSNGGKYLKEGRGVHERVNEGKASKHRDSESHVGLSWLSRPSLLCGQVAVSSVADRGGRGTDEGKYVEQKKRGGEEIKKLLIFKPVITARSLGREASSKKGGREGG